jgi:plasmid stability protein
MPKAKPAPDDEPEYVQLQIRLKATTLNKLRLKAAKEGRAMSSHARMVIEQSLRPKRQAAEAKPTTPAGAAKAAKRAKRVMRQAAEALT